MSRCNTAILFAVLAALGGCIPGPGTPRRVPQVSDVTAAKGPFSGAGTQGTVDGPAQTEWWRLYQDDTLNGLVSEALKANTDIRVASATLVRNHALLDATQDRRFPQLSLGANPVYARDSAEEQLVPGPLPNFFGYSADAGVSYEVDLLGRVRHSIEAQTANVDEAKANRTSVQLAVVAATVLAYVNACAAGREATVTRHAIDLQASSTGLAVRRFQGGRSGSLDVTRSSAQESALRAGLPALLDARRRALFRLAVLTGRPPESVPVRATECTQEPSLAHPIPIGDGAALLRRRPDVAADEANVRRTVASYGVTYADLYPRITLGGMGASIGLLGHFLADDTYKFAIGPLVTWQFPDRRRARAALTVGQAEIDQAQARLDATVLRALEDVETVLSTYAADLDRLADLRTTQSTSAQASTDARRLFELGREGYLSVLDADRGMAAVDEAVAAQQTAVAADQVRLFLALGGGWQ